MNPTPKQRILKILARAAGAEFDVSAQELRASQAEVEREETRLASERRALEATMAANRKLVESGTVLNPALMMAGGQSGVARRDALVAAQRALTVAETKRQNVRDEADRLRRRIDKLEEFSGREQHRQRTQIERKDQVAADDVATQAKVGERR